VFNKDEAQTAVNLGARILMVTNVEGAEDKSAVIEGLKIPEGQQVCTIANILARKNKQLEEIEEAWVCRDKGFNAVWVSDALYKAGADATEHPGAIIKGMLAKSSVRWASPKARSGKGEGAREYLGDILM
jgi:indole-3-glycerol phosphate synthase